LNENGREPQARVRFACIGSNATPPFATDFFDDCWLLLENRRQVFGFAEFTFL